MTALGEASACRFEHEAFLYDSDDQYAAVLVPPMVEAIDSGDVVVAVVPDDAAERLGAALGDRCERVSWISAAEWYEHPVRTVAAYDGLLRRVEPGARAFVVGQVQFGATEADWWAWTEYEAALNDALERYAARVICPYDVRALPQPVVAHARRTHPVVLDGHDRLRSGDFLEPEAMGGVLPEIVPVPDGPPVVEVVVGQSVRPGRVAFAAAARDAGLPASRVEELTLAVSEVLTNAVVHGGGLGSLRVWCAPGEHVTCVVDDRGPGSDDWLLGYRPPPSGAEAGYGLWLARRLFDRTAVGRSPDGGLRVVLRSEA